MTNLNADTEQNRMRKVNASWSYMFLEAELSATKNGEWPALYVIFDYSQLRAADKSS